MSYGRGLAFAPRHLTFNRGLARAFDVRGRLRPQPRAARLLEQSDLLIHLGNAPSQSSREIARTLAIERREMSTLWLAKMLRSADVVIGPRQ